MTARSIPSSRMCRSAASRSSGRSPTIVISATSTPSSPSRSESHGPLRSVTKPLSTSVPVTRIPARTLTAPFFRNGPAARFQAAFR